MPPEYRIRLKQAHVGLAEDEILHDHMYFNLGIVVA